jgi:hypothetical protein
MTRRDRIGLVAGIGMAGLLACSGAASTRVDSVGTFTGQAFEPGGAQEELLVFGAAAGAGAGGTSRNPSNRS